MNSVLTALRRLFGRRISEPPRIKSALVFPQIDVEGLKNQLRLEEEGRKRGAHNNPTSDMDHYDDIEQKIISILESEAKETTQSFEAHLDTYTQRINSLLHSTKLDHINSPVRSILRRVADSEASIGGLPVASGEASMGDR